MTKTLKLSLLAALILGLSVILAGFGAPGGPATPPEAATSAGTGHPLGAAAAADHAAHQHESLPAMVPLPGRSLYHLQGSWLDHHGGAFELAALRGQPVVIVMFYASCETACPILIRDVLRLEEELLEPQRSRTQFIMITVDPETDAPERMARYVHENDLAAPNWHFLSGSEQQTRAIAALLGVSYRAAGGGMFSHTNLISVLDPDGVITQRTDGLAQSVTPALEAINAIEPESLARYS